MAVILRFDTPRSVESWITVDDVVMGGRSDSQVRWLPGEDQSGMLRFEGEVSLENNGGFCSTRNQGQWDLGGARELIWTLRGTERTFLATLRDNDTPDGASFRHPFSPAPGEWTDVALPLEEFRLFRRGKKLSDQTRVDPSQIHSFGFLLADGNAGSFHLDVQQLQV